MHGWNGNISVKNAVNYVPSNGNEANTSGIGCLSKSLFPIVRKESLSKFSNSEEIVPVKKLLSRSSTLKDLRVKISSAISPESSLRSLFQSKMLEFV